MRGNSTSTQIVCIDGKLFISLYRIYKDKGISARKGGLQLQGSTNYISNMYIGFNYTLSSINLYSIFFHLELPSLLS